MRHPFQRKKNKKSPIATPFQKELVGQLESFSGSPGRMSGRQLSLLLGKSANHLSQMLNDGLVPSGQTILDMAEVLKLDPEATDQLIRAAMETKAQQRSRDNFWINETSRMLKQADERIGLYREFLRKSGQDDAFRRFAEAREEAPDPRSSEA